MSLPLTGGRFYQDGLERYSLGDLWQVRSSMLARNNERMTQFNGKGYLLDSILSCRTESQAPFNDGLFLLSDSQQRNFVVENATRR
jgi:hypothetical protein